MYIRNCPNCNKEISYTNNGNLNRAARSNKLCKSCSVKLRNDNQDYLKKISDGRKKYWSELSDDDKEILRLKNSESKKILWEGRDDKFKNYWSELISISSKKRWSNEEYKDKLIRAMSEHPWTLNKSDDEIKDIMNKVNLTKYERYGTLFPGGGNKKKITEISGLICESSYEVKYIKSLIASNSKLPKNGKPILTPYGYYTPDFEFDNEFVEIKCKFTYDVLMGNTSFSSNKESNPYQLKKIKWVNDNIKAVNIIIID